MGTNINAEYINPFLEAAISVFKTIVGVSLKRGKLAMKNHPEPTMDVAIIIGITGDIQGVVVYSMSIDMVYKIAEILSPGLSKEQIKEEYKDIVGELANMITGNAMNLFSNINKGVEVTTPTVISGKDFSITAVQQTTLVVNLSSPHGTLEMNIALK
ncbi:MAG: chemotaxis protein CheX [Spirochaetota bacterium]|nr:chemotaxis protein CheX [Spirochaetota bacterium]